MRLTAITCTGGRPEAFAFCERWIARQTRQPDEWIVVDDGPVPTLTTMGQTVLRFEPGLPGHLSFSRNVTEGVRAATGDVIVFPEDDDWFGPGHLADVAG